MTDSAATWKPGFRHCVEWTSSGWRCVDCGRAFGDVWPSDDEGCPGPATEDDLRRAGTEANVERIRLRYLHLTDQLAATRRGRSALWLARWIGRRGNR